MKTRISVRPFTLIEVLIVMAIAAIVGSSLLFVGKRGLERYRAISSSEKVIARLNLATELMVCCEMTITLIFEEGMLTLHAEEPLPEPFVKLLDKPLLLPGIHTMSPSTLTFSPHRRDLFPSGTLLLNNTQTIDLPGYPTQIRGKSR